MNSGYRSNRRARLPGNWTTLRQRILDRDHHTCQHCGGPGNEVDHRDGTDNHHPDNLQTLCTNCHARKTRTQAAEAQAARHARAKHPTTPHPGIT